MSDTAEKRRFYCTDRATIQDDWPDPIPNPDNLTVGR